jgi:hypothetical protein
MEYCVHVVVIQKADGAEQAQHLVGGCLGEMMEPGDYDVTDVVGPLGKESSIMLPGCQEIGKLRYL